MTETVTPAAILMDVLERMEAPAFMAQVEAGGGIRPDGVRPPLWEVRFKLNHVAAAAAADPAPWLDELEHSLVHVMGAPSHEALRGALVHHAALTAAWIRDLDGREA